MQALQRVGSEVAVVEHARRDERMRHLEQQCRAAAGEQYSFTPDAPCQRRRTEQPRIARRTAAGAGRQTRQ